MSDIKYIALEIFDNQIRYDGRVIYSGNVKDKTQAEIDNIVDAYKSSEKQPPARDVPKNTDNLNTSGEHVQGLNISERDGRRDIGAAIDKARNFAFGKDMNDTELATAILDVCDAALSAQRDGREVDELVRIIKASLDRDSDTARWKTACDALKTLATLPTAAGADKEDGGKCVKE